MRREQILFGALTYLFFSVPGYAQVLYYNGAVGPSSTTDMVILRRDLSNPGAPPEIVLTQQSLDTLNQEIYGFTEPIVVDAVAGKFYWYSYGPPNYMLIMRANLNGSGVEMVANNQIGDNGSTFAIYRPLSVPAISFLGLVILALSITALGVVLIARSAKRQLHR